MIDPEFIIRSLEQASYVGIFIPLTFIGYILPIPEEILLLSVGYVAGFGAINLYTALAVAILGIMIGDNTLFFLIRGSSKYIRWLEKKIEKHKLLEHRHLMERNMGKTIFLLRFLSGLRILAPFLAGSMRVRWRIFFLYHTLAVLIYAPSLIFLGYYFRNQIVAFMAGIGVFNRLLFVGIMAIVGIAVWLFVIKKIYNKSKAPVLLTENFKQHL